ncbi:MAG: lipocalin family protein [Nitrospirales bacterium]
MKPFQYGLALLLLAGACATIDPAKEIPTARSVDLVRYMGTWHEVARLPMWAQRDCVQSTAEYRQIDTTRVAVRNACRTLEGESISIEGVATVVDPINHAKLNVVFDQWAAKLVALLTSSEQGNYWILQIDPDYQLAIVGTPDRDYLWILSRAPTLDDTAYQEAVAFCRSLGFQTEHLIRPSL